MAFNKLLFVAIYACCIHAGSSMALDSLTQSSTCTYTFNVPRDGGLCLPGAQENLNIDTLQATMTNQHALLEHQLNLITEKLVQINGNGGSSGDDDDSHEVNNGSTPGGTVYTHWGRTSCPDTADMIYEGFVGKSYHTHGGGVNYLCLPREPEFPEGATEGHQSQSYIYGVEYERHNSPLIDQSHHDNDVPCAVCDVTGRSRTLLIPAKMSCPNGWVKEYQGLLMAQHHTQAGSDFICVADGMENLAGGSPNANGGLLYVVETVCGSLKCPPYVEGKEIACVICTK